MVAEEPVIPNSVVAKLDLMENEVQKKLKAVELNLHQNPLAIFYKDEGGKSNYLTASCRVSLTEEVESKKDQIPIGNLKISPKLVYEDGGEIEDEDEIFNVLSVEPKTLTSSNEIFTVNFRVEKVSRRKDGKRFRIKFLFNEAKSNLLDYIDVNSIEPVTTSAVTVLSKRKSHQLAAAQMAANEPKTDRRTESKFSSDRIKKRRQSSTCSASNNEQTVTLPVGFLMKVRENMAHLENSVNILSQRVSALEGNLTKDRQEGFSGGKRVHSLMFDEAFPNRNRVETPVIGFNAPGNATTGIKRNGSSTHELFEFLSSSSFLN